MRALLRRPSRPPARAEIAHEIASLYNPDMEAVYSNPSLQLRSAVWVTNTQLASISQQQQHQQQPNASFRHAAGAALAMPNPAAAAAQASADLAVEPAAPPDAAAAGAATASGPAPPAADSFDEYEELFNT